MCRLAMPLGWQEPDTTPHLQEMLAAFPLYAEYPHWNPTPVHRRDYQLVCKYVDGFGGPEAERIIANYMQGVSIVIHEIVEMEYYLQQGFNPFDRRQFSKALDDQLYAVGHALGLIAEHCFIQDRAAGQDFRLGELIRWNPFAGRPALDLRYFRLCVERGGSGVDNVELEIRQERRAAVYTWYRSQAFQGRYPRDVP